MFGIVMYALIIGLACYLFLAETADWFCDDLRGMTTVACRGEGMPYRGSTPDEKDDVPTLLNRIKAGASAERNSIKWRRAAMYSVFIMLAVWALVMSPGSLPPWHQFYMTVIIGFAFLYFGFNFFSYHYNSIPEENIKKALKMLKTKLNINNDVTPQPAT